MQIQEVDFPQALIDAHRNGELVIFVGAGASMGAPSNLPSFRQLAWDVATDAGVPHDDERRKHDPDVLLGELDENDDFDVHDRVRTRIGVAASLPTPLHEAIAALAVAGPRMRVLTTNYDAHLSSALSEAGNDVPTYMAPALPLGDDFEGLVYLHGSVQQESRFLVVTDVDFGRAYLRDAWATRFLERVFSTYTVLFIGYSHSDIVMSYLAKGLGRDDSRYVLTHEPKKADWRRLGVKPVGYPVVDGSHSAVVDAVCGWAAWASMGLLGHRRRIAELVSVPPSQIPEENAYLESVVADQVQVRLFAEFARLPEWLTWASNHPELERLFDPAASPTGCTRTLAYWFAEHFVLDEATSNQALAVLHDLGGRLGSEAWSAIGHHFHMDNRPRPEWLGAWLVALIQQAPVGFTEWLDYALVKTVWDEDKAAALLLFDFLTEPQPGHRPKLASEDGLAFEVHLRGDSHWMREAWTNLFTPHLSAAASAVLPIIDRHLRKAHHLVTTADNSRSGFDPLSFTRSAIEPHEQDSVGSPADILIDAARDSLETLLETDSEWATDYMRSWAMSDVPLFRRLAIHGWIVRNDIDATAKIAWLLERDWLFDHQLRHEVFRLVETSLPHAHPDVAEALVADAAAGPDGTDDDNLRDYLSFNALAWIAHHAPGLQSATAGLRHLQEAHPEFEQRRFPDLTSSWTVSEATETFQPMTIEHLHDLIASDAAAALAELRTHQETTSPFEHPNWDDSLSTLRRTVREWPADGFVVLEADDDHVIFDTVVQGWLQATPDPDTSECILMRLIDADLSGVSHEIADFLSNESPAEDRAGGWRRGPTARKLAAAVWQALEPASISAPQNDWLSRAINHPAGKLARFWLDVIADDWRGAGDDWQGLPPAIRDNLETLLAADDGKAVLAEVVLASQLHFFFAADREWCIHRVLPLLSWADDPDRARRAWDGFLYWGRWNDHLLNAGLAEDYLAAAERIASFPDRLQERLCAHLAAIALSSELNADVWLPRFTSTANESVRAQWINQVTWALRELPPDAVERQWQRWMRTYWQNRLNSTPATLTDSEASAIACWVPYLTSSTADGVAFAASRSAAVAPHSDFLRSVTDEQIALAPAQFAHLVTHLLTSTQEPFWQCDQLKRIVGTLRARPTPIDTSAIVQEALRLGCGQAPDW